MKDVDILNDIEELNKKKEISKKELLTILKKYGRTISSYDLMLATALLREDGKYVQKNYREKFLKTYIKYFILRIKEILETPDDIDGMVNKNLFNESLENLTYQFYKEKEDNKKNSKFPLIYTLASLYSTFINEEPIHPAGSEFPGNLQVYQEDDVFYCPVKDAQKENPNAVCNFCLAKQTPGI